MHCAVYVYVIHKSFNTCPPPRTHKHSHTHTIFNCATRTIVLRCAQKSSEIHNPHPNFTRRSRKLSERVHSKMRVTIYYFLWRRMRVCEVNINYVWPQKFHVTLNGKKTRAIGWHSLDHWWPSLTHVYCSNTDTLWWWWWLGREVRRSLLVVSNTSND